MPIAEISSRETLKNLKSNKAHNWPAYPGTPSRLQPFTRPNISPSFALKPGEKIFTIGSCFARNIEVSLEKLGFQIPTRKVSVPYEEYQNSFLKGQSMPPLTLENEIINKYNPHAMLNEFRWSLDSQYTFPFEEAFISCGNDLWIDPHLIFYNPAPFEIVKQHRRMVAENTAQVRNCRVIVMTFGLAEAWWDTKTELYLNSTPPISVLEKETNRFSLHVLSYGDIVSTFVEIHQLLKQNCPNDFRILLTVSPVPLIRTFTNQDILIANMYAKSVLRAAAQEIEYNFDNVDYFPSYESVVMSERSLAWLSDQRHVTEDLINFNVTRLYEAYIDPNYIEKFEIENSNPNANAMSYTELTTILVELENNYKEAMEHLHVKIASQFEIIKDLNKLKHPEEIDDTGPSD